MSTVSSVIGTVVRLQVQTGPLKPRPSGSGRYDPTPLRTVDAMELTGQGCVGLLGGERLVDVHHVEHPLSRNVREVNGLSLLPSAHYAALRATYGDHVVDGAAGENVLLATAGPWTAADLAGELMLEVDSGVVALTDPMAAPPCLEFSRWCLGRAEVGARDGGVDDVDEELAAALDHLDHGLRGFYLRPQTEGILRLGHRLLRA